MKHEIKYEKGYWRLYVGHSSLPFQTKGEAEAHLALIAKHHPGMFKAGYMCPDCGAPVDEDVLCDACDMKVQKDYAMPAEPINEPNTHYCMNCHSVLIPKQLAFCPACQPKQAFPPMDSIVEQNKAAAKKAGMSGPWLCSCNSGHVWNKGDLCEECQKAKAFDVEPEYPVIPVELTAEEKQLCMNGQNIAAIKSVRTRFQGPYKKLGPTSHSLKHMKANMYVNPDKLDGYDYADMTDGGTKPGGGITLLDAKDSVDAYAKSLQTCGNCTKRYEPGQSCPWCAAAVKAYLAANPQTVPGGAAMKYEPETKVVLPSWPQVREFGCAKFGKTIMGHWAIFLGNEEQGVQTVCIFRDGHHPTEDAVCLMLATLHASS